MEGRRDSAIGAVLLEEAVEELGQRRDVAAEGGDGTACLGQTVHGQAACAVQVGLDLRGVGAVGEQGLGDLELDGEGPEGVGEQVVDLAGDPCPLIEGGGPGLLVAGALGLGQQLTRLFGSCQVLTPIQSKEQRGGEGEAVSGDRRAPRATGQDGCGGHRGDAGEREPGCGTGCEPDDGLEHADRRKGDSGAARCEPGDDATADDQDQQRRQDDAAVVCGGRIMTSQASEATVGGDRDGEWAAVGSRPRVGSRRGR